MKILIVDDHALFRAGLELLLGQLLVDTGKGIQISQAATASQALGMLSAGNVFDLVLLDWHMPDVQGVDALVQIRNQLPRARLVVMSGDSNPKLVQLSIENGASGFIPKDSPTDKLALALEMVVNDGIYLPALQEDNLRSFDTSSGLAAGQRPSPAPAPMQSVALHFPSLSPRQLEVLQAMARGLPNKLIARELNIGEDTVKHHLSAIYQILNVSNRTEAVYLISKLGLSIV